MHDLNKFFKYIGLAEQPIHFLKKENKLYFTDSNKEVDFFSYLLLLHPSLSDIHFQYSPIKGITLSIRQYGSIQYINSFIDIKDLSKIYIDGYCFEIDCLKNILLSLINSKIYTYDFLLEFDLDIVGSIRLRGGIMGNDLLIRILIKNKKNQDNAFNSFLFYHKNTVIYKNCFKLDNDLNMISKGEIVCLSDDIKLKFDSFTNIIYQIMKDIDPHNLNHLYNNYFIFYMTSVLQADNTISTFFDLDILLTLKESIVFLNAIKHNFDSIDVDVMNLLFSKLSDLLNLYLGINFSHSMLSVHDIDNYILLIEASQI